MSQSSTFSYEIITDDIAVITMDVPGENQNTLRDDFINEVDALFDELEKKNLTGVIFTSGKKDSFIVGADINMLSKLKTTEEVRALAAEGYRVFKRIENFKVPVVSEIHGTCMGGGVELSLACHGRVCSDHPSTILALPEVQLGLLPGGGGTQRLPALVGVAEALTIMTTGKNIRAKKALKIGLVDDVTDVLNLRKASIKRIKTLGRESLKEDTFDYKSLLSISGWQSLLLEKNQPGLNFLFQEARKKVNAKTKGNYPAPLKIIDCVEAWTRGNKEYGYEVEAKNFAELILTPEAKQLIHLFFSITDLKKHHFVSEDINPVEINNLAVLGGGLMGAGIALVSADKTDAKVRIKDISEKSVNHGLKYAWDRLQTKVKRRHLTKQQADEKMAKITGTTDFSGIQNADLVIEAVFESLELKHQMLKDIEIHCSKNTIFATNTSSIPISEIAKVAKRPENVIGMHYFSPVEKMPLLELIVIDKTSEQTIATAVDFGRKQGKTVIVVNDSAGFYTSRVLGPYMNEAGHLLASGVPVELIDKAIVNLGYPVGPITLLDEVGIDVGTKITPILASAFGERMTPPQAFMKLSQSGREGKKNKKGFYDYSYKGKKKRPVDESVYLDLGISPHNKMDPLVIAERCNLMLVNEAIRCLEEGILKSARDGDIGAIFGLGFPPYLGGPFRFADQFGIKRLIERLEHYKESEGDRFTPAQLLYDMEKSGETFYS